ncbi:hypothetical protein XELAEV_18016673mg [Xenopus laevis]|uniref:Secreted protein n=1 Tax=Xenopus laevis TaxID=8355 RepID=A0A974D9M2_XENLA|nr:hypothetical protein XELAEV_18016673mg [Xenopus laevis]
MCLAALLLYFLALSCSSNAMHADKNADLLHSMATRSECADLAVSCLMARSEYGSFIGVPSLCLTQPHKANRMN